ncbi:MAG: hypothetical protein M9933_10570 [Chitinophagaceae bacterium]|nr:hypothetical protein [Chitinophagaceae bacterium]
MKLLMVMSLKEFQQQVAKIFKQANIKVFSASETTGFKENGFEGMMEGWYAGGIGNYESVFLFSFTADENAERAMELIKEYNNSKECQFPIRAFIIPVEQSS